MNTKLHDENVDFLFDAILTLKNREECYKFFEDLCTVPELKAMVAAHCGCQNAQRAPRVQRYRR